MKLTEKMVKNLHKAEEFSFNSSKFKGNMYLNWTDENDASCSYRMSNIEADREEECSCCTYSSQKPLIQAVMKQLQVGDELEYVWNADIDIPRRMKEPCNIHIDTFVLRVIRNGDYIEYPLVTKTSKLDDEYRMIRIPVPKVESEEEQSA